MNNDLIKYWKNYNKEIFEARLVQCNLSKEQYTELKNSAIAILNGLNASFFDDAKMFIEAKKTLGITFGSEGPLSYDEDIIKLFKELLNSKRWYITTKNPDNIRKRYPETLDLWIHNLDRAGGYTTLIRWK